MRDHWLDLLPPRAFARWRHSQVAAFGLNYPAPEAGDAPGGEDELVAGDTAGTPSVPSTAGGTQPASEGAASPTSLMTPPDDAAVASSSTRESADDKTSEATASVLRSLAIGAWVAPTPLLSVEAQLSEGGRWHVPIPLGDSDSPAEDQAGEPLKQQWLCFTVEQDD